MFVQAGGWASHDDDVRLPIARQVHDFRAASQGDVGFEGDRFEGSEVRLHDLAAVARGRYRAPIALVVPGARLLGEDAGNAFAVQVGPAVGTAVQAYGKVFKARRINLLDDLLHGRHDVFELDRRQAALGVAPAIAGLSNSPQESIDGVSDIGGIDFVGIFEICRAHQAVASNIRLVWKVVEHQYASAKASGADLKAGTVGGERVWARFPRVFQCPCRVFCLVVVQRGHV